MNAILIKPTDKSIYSKFMELIRSTKVPAKILSADEELDLLLSDGIEEGMKTGEGSKEEMRKFFRKHGLQID